MSTKSIIYDNSKITNGVNKLVDVVAATLGPNGKNIGFVSGSKVINTKDGVTVAKKAVPFEDKVENYAAQIVKRAADQAVEKAGDGTTTTCVLTRAIYEAAMSVIKTTSVPVSTICRQLQEIVKRIDNSLKARELTPESSEFKSAINIATNGDNDLTEIITDAFKRVGKDGIITVEPADGKETTLEKVEGLCFDTGFISPYFVTNADKMRVEYSANIDGTNAPYVLLYDGVLNTADSILHILDEVNTQRRALLIIAEDVTGECLSSLIINKLRLNASFVAVKSPGYGDGKKNWLHDIAAVTGAKVVDPKIDDIREMGTSCLGTVKRMTIDNRETTLVGLNSNDASLETYIKNLETYLTTEKEDYYREKLQERIARLRSGVTIIKLAAFNDVESQEKSDRIDDAIKAGKAALKSGVVPGCGVALYKATKDLNPDELAAGILASALRAPITTILKNAGFNALQIETWLEHISDNEEAGLRIENGIASTVDDCYAEGIVDPKLVVITALEEAVAAASLLMNTAAVIVENDEKKSCECR